MSLLLDALKKAAEEKQQAADRATARDAEQGVDLTEQATDTGQPAQQSPSSFSNEATEFDVTASAAPNDNTATNDVAHAATDQTQLEDETDIAADLTSFDIEPLDAPAAAKPLPFGDTEIGNTKQHREATELEPTSPTDAQRGVDLDATEVADLDEAELRMEQTALDATEIQDFTGQGGLTTAPPASTGAMQPTSLTDNFIKEKSAYSPKDAGSLVDMGRPAATNRWRLFILASFTAVVALGVLGLFAYQYYIETSEIDYKVSYAQLRPRNLNLETDAAQNTIAPTTNASENATLSTASSDTALESEDEIVVAETDYTAIIDQAFDAIEAQAEARREDTESTAAQAPVEAAATPAPVVEEPTPVVKANPIRIQRREDTQVSTLIQQAYAAFQEGDMLIAKNYYQQALAQQPTNRDAQLGNAAIALIEGDNATARALYATILQDNPGDAAALAGITSLGPVADSATASTDTISNIKLMLQQQPEAPQLHFALANALADQARWAEAQQAFFEAFRRDETNPDYLYNLAVSLDNLGKQDSALNFYRQALLLSGTRPNNVPLIATEQRINALQVN